MTTTLAQAVFSTDVSGLRDLVVQSVRWLGYLGFVLLAGTTFFLGWLWPRTRVEPLLRRLLVGGGVVTLLTTVALPLLDTAGRSAFTGREGACALARLALLSLGVAFGDVLLRAPRRTKALSSLWVLALVETYVLASDAVGEPWRLVRIVATTGHLAATACWLGGLLALAVVLIPRRHDDVLDEIIPRFSVVAFVSVVVLVMTGVVHALAVAGSWRSLIDSRYGTMLVLKVAIFALMLLLGNVGRQYAARVAGRPIGELDETAPAVGVQALAVAIGAELALALAVLGVTAALVDAVPR